MKTTQNILWRCIVAGLVFTITTVLAGAGMVLLFGRVNMPAPGMMLWLTTTFVAGFLIGATLGPIAARLHTPRWRTIFTWTCILFFNLVSVVIEGRFFALGLLPASMVVRMMIQFLIVSIVMGIVINRLFPSWTNYVRYGRRPHRALYSWVLRCIGSAASYLVFYYFFGAINYQLVTKPYYQMHASLAIPDPQTVIIAESVRAVLIILSILPLFTALYTIRKRLVLFSGFTLFVIGGVVPLLMQVGAMPLTLLLASGVEMFFQNFLTGVVAALLLGRFREVAVRRQRYFVVE